MFWKSKGFGRAFGILISALSLVPAFAPYSEALVQIGALIGVAGVANATLK
jgi:hypothetical protein